MKRLLVVASLILLSALAVSAQNGHVQDIALGSVSQSTALGYITYLTPLAGATVTVCTSTAVGTPCSPKAQLCFNEADTFCQQQNPVTADSAGNYSFWVAAGANYVVTVMASGYATKVLTYSVPIDPTGPITLTSSLTVNGGVTSPSFTLSGAPNPRCLHTVAGGAIAPTTFDCFNAGASITYTGTPVANQGAYWSGGSTVTGSSNWTYNPTSGHAVTQGSNGSTALLLKRFTDSSPTGYLLQFQNAVGGGIAEIDSFGDFLSPAFVDVTSINPALSGVVRLGHGDAVAFRNAANSGDVSYQVNAFDRPSWIGNAGANTITTANGPVVPGHLAVWYDVYGTLQDGGAPGVYVIANGTITFNSGNITAPNCEAATTVSAPGVTSADTISWAWNAQPTGSDRMVTMIWSAGTGTVTFQRCNTSGAGQNVSANTINWKVTR